MYGTFSDYSDFDYLEVYKQDFDSLILGERFKSNHQIDEFDDVVSHNVTKFLRLASKCNPNILDSLFVDNEFVCFSDKTGKLILKNRYLFLSQQVRTSFVGYAFTNLLKLKKDCRKKHVIHLIRLMLKAKSILKTCDYNPTLTKEEKDFIDYVVCEELSFDELKNTIDTLKKEVYAIQSTLPHEVDIDKVDELLLQIYKPKTLLFFEQLRDIFWIK